MGAKGLVVLWMDGWVCVHMRSGRVKPAKLPWGHVFISSVLHWVSVCLGVRASFPFPLLRHAAVGASLAVPP